MTSLVSDEIPDPRSISLLNSRVSKLRQTRGNEGRYSSYVLPRIVRLTIETNTLTGRYTSTCSSLPFGFTFLFS